jgi:hypothetical protein
VTEPRPHPVRIIITDDLHRSRLTAFFRFFLAIPHYIWAFLIGQAVAIAVFVNWFILMFKAKTPDGLHKFIAGYLRYLTQLEAYFLLAANPYPGFYPVGDEKKGYPVDVHFDPPERQNRWKTFFRLFLAIPALLIGSTLFFGGPRSGSYFVGGLAFIVSFFAWFVAVIRGRVPRGMRDLMVYCLGYAAQLSAYLFLVTDRYPYSGPDAYLGQGESAAEPPAEPEWVIETIRPEGELTLLTLVTYENGEFAGRRAVRLPSATVAGLEAGQPAPEAAFGVRVPAPAAEPLPEPEQHPVSLTMSDELRRSRLLTFFRLPLSIPHVVWLLLWAIVAMVVAVLAWLCALAIGRTPRPFHRFLARFIRYGTHLTAFLYMVGNPFPGFVGKPGSYPIDLVLPEPGEPQKRVVTFFRGLLAFPALMILFGVYGALGTAAFLGWFVALFLGRMPAGLRGLGAYSLRYGGQVNAYLYLLTARYPDSGPRPDPTSP